MPSPLEMGIDSHNNLNLPDTITPNSKLYHPISSSQHLHMPPRPSWPQHPSQLQSLLQDVAQQHAAVLPPRRSPPPQRLASTWETQYFSGMLFSSNCVFVKGKIDMSIFFFLVNQSVRSGQLLWAFLLHNEIVFFRPLNKFGNVILEDDNQRLRKNCRMV